MKPNTQRQKGFRYPVKTTLAVAGMGVLVAMGATTVAVSSSPPSDGNVTLAKATTSLQATPNVTATTFAGGHWAGLTVFKGKDWPGMGNYAGGHNGKGALS